MRRSIEMALGSGDPSTRCAKSVEENFHHFHHFHKTPTVASEAGERAPRHGIDGTPSHRHSYLVLSGSSLLV
jgi:hypothetical protein